MPIAVSRVPSIGSTATSASAPVPSPTSSPLNSIGASSFSPSPMTTTPRIATVPMRRRMASTAAASASFFSPSPTQRPAAMAAASVTRTSSSARLRSGVSVAAITPPHPLRRLLGRPCAIRTLGREPLLRAVEPRLAQHGQLLAALPQRERCLERKAAGLELPHDLEEFVAGGLVGDRLRRTRQLRSPRRRGAPCRSA